MSELFNLQKRGEAVITAMKHEQRDIHSADARLSKLKRWF